MSTTSSKLTNPRVGFLRGSLVFGGIGGLLVFSLLFPLLMQSREEALSSKACFHTFKIQQALENYALSHHGHYPDGKSSTEIFQTLLDEHFVDDPSLFYFPISGKTKAETNHLKAENVSWDITSGVDSNTPDKLPVIFSTGYKVDYVANGSAKSLMDAPFFYRRHLVFATKGSSCSLYPVTADNSVLHFIPADFVLTGHSYHQLTPDGELSP